MDKSPKKTPDLISGAGNNTSPNKNKAIIMSIKYLIVCPINASAGGLPASEKIRKSRLTWPNRNECKRKPSGTVNY